MSINRFLVRLKKYRNNEDITIQELLTIMKTNEEAILLDVRSPQEYEEGHLDGAINIPLYELEKCCSCKLKDKEKLTIVYCQSGIRSRKAIAILKRCGFKNLYNLSNGLDGI